MEEVDNTLLRCVEEGSGHRVVLSISTEKLRRERKKKQVRNGRCGLPCGSKGCQAPAGCGAQRLCAGKKAAAGCKDTTAAALLPGSFAVGDCGDPRKVTLQHERGSHL